VLAHLDAIRVVALGLLRLVVAPLALLALKGDGDSYVSASHGSCWFGDEAAGAKENPAAARFSEQDSAPGPGGRLGLDPTRERS
jgi:hypothetical protein